MDERAACRLLKQRFEAAGFHIEENRTFDEAGVRFEIDGFDPQARVGYEYVTREAGDDWDVDDQVIAALAARRAAGDLHILVVDERIAEHAAGLETVAAAFLAELPRRHVSKPGPAPAPVKPTRARARPKTTMPASTAARRKKPAKK